MRALLWMTGAVGIPGGHRVQIEKTAAHLACLGVDTIVCYCDNPDLKFFDVVHGFGLTPQSIRKCRQSGIPVVLSTIYWSRAYVMGVDRPEPLARVARRRLRLGLGLLAATLCGRHREKCEAILERVQRQKVAYEMADLLLPNSALEEQQIRSDLAVTTPAHVIPNAVDPELFTPPPTTAARDGVIYVGRFEPHKNQLGLIRAMRSSALKVTLVGPPHPHHAQYYDDCRRAAGSNTTIIDGAPHEELARYYSRAKVHVLPSWFETTGLVSLEAGLCGCNIVTTNRGYAKEYFGELAWYCDPASPAGIRTAVEQAHAAPASTSLRERILSRYTWACAARQTRAAYEWVLNRCVPAYSF